MTVVKPEKEKLSRFALTERTPEPDLKVVEAAIKSGESICPCGQEDVGYRCTKCGATQHVSSVNGNVTWMRNGRVVRAFHDERAAYVEMANNYGIPKERWPVQFQ